MGIELGKTTGKINLTNVSGNIELNNNNGNVDLTNEKENIELNGVSGDIELVIKGGGSSVEIDDTLSIAGAAADAAATGYAIGTIKDELDNYDEGAMVSATNLTPEKRINLRVRNKNVFDVSTIHIGYTAESYGNGFKTNITKRTNTKHCAAHDNVIVKPDTHYVFSLDNTHYWVARIIEVDKDNLCVRNHAYYATKQDNAVKEFITKETTVKLYIAFEKKDGTPATMEEVVALNFQLEVGDTPTPFTPYVDVANREITITGKNIFKPTGGISASDFENKEIGDKIPTEFIEGIYQIHPYTPLKPNTYYTYSTQATRGQGWHGYMAKEIYEADENDIIVAKYSFTPEQPYSKFTFKTTPTTKYMLVNIGGIAFTTGTTLSEKDLKIRDFQFEEGNDESGSDFYYEETYTTDKNGCVNGIAFPRDKAHAHIKDKGLVIELEVEEVEIKPDTTLSQTGIAADAAATGYAIGEIREEIASHDEGRIVSATNLTPETKVNLKVKSKNEFDISGITLGKSIYGGSVGSPVYRLDTKADCATHPYVPVKPSTHYVFSLDNTNYWLYRICEMDENDLTIRNHGYYGTDSDFSVKSFITKETTKYLYIEFRNKNGEEATLEGLEATHFQLEIGDTPTPFTPYTSGINREIKVIGKNILNGDNGIGASDFENKEIGAKMPTEFIAGKNQIHPYIPVKPDTYYTFSFQAARGLGWQSYMVKEIFEADENDVIVARYLFDESHNKYTFKTTPTTKYILVSIAFINGNSVSNAGYQLRVRDFQLEEGKDESATDFYYEETYTTDENGLIEGITFPRTELNAYPIDKGLIIELEVEEVEASNIELDTTLSVEGAAADAKATGEAINEVKEKTELLMEDYIGAFPISTHPNSTFNTKYDYVNALTLPEGKYAINKHTKTVILGATADDGTVKTITLYPIDNTVIEVSTNNAYVFLSSDAWDYRWRVALADTSTSSKIEAIRVLNLYLGVNNNVEYTPTQNYHPATKKYVDDSIKVDTTLTAEGVAADAMATGDAIKGKSNIKYYALDIATLQANGVAAAATNISSPNSGSYTLNINITIVPTIFENGVETKIIDAPFKFLNINGAVWNNKNEFRGVGISSPAIAQTLGITDILWFEGIGNVMSNVGMARDSFTYKLFDNSKGYPQGTIAIQMSTSTSNYSVAQQVKGLWDAMFATPGTKIIFEYENQENVETYNAEILYLPSATAASL